MKVLITLLAAAFLALTISTLPAQAYGRATVIKGFECIIIPRDSGLPFVLFTNNMTHEVDTSSGNSVLQCHFDIPEGFEPASTLHHEGFLCATFLGITRKSRSVTTQGGKVLLTCQVSHN